MIDQINELPKDGVKSLPETLCYIENKWISQKNQNKLYFLHLIDILNDLLLIYRTASEIPFLDCSNLAINLKNNTDATICQHNVIA